MQSQGTLPASEALRRSELASILDQRLEASSARTGPALCRAPAVRPRPASSVAVVGAVAIAFVVVFVALVTPTYAAIAVTGCCGIGALLYAARA